MYEVVIIALVKIALLIACIMGSAAYFVLLERRVAAWVQDRRGPNRVGVPWTKIRVFGLGQPLADGLKMLFKEEFTPAQVDRRLYIIAPIVIMAAALAVFAVIPFGSALPPIPSLGLDQPIPLIVAPLFDVGLVYVFALSSIAVYGVILGGWSSNSKYSFLGAVRSSAQMIAYELPLGLAILGVIVATSSLRLTDIIDQQAAQGVWFAFAQPLGFIIFVVAAFAEAGRLPFDLAECEQELVAGYHTEYSGMKLVLFLTAEFIHMITAALLIVVLFLGGWHLWGVTGGPDTVITWPQAWLRIAVLGLKVVAVIFFFMMARWSWPRFRFDQLMTLAWKVMLPLGIANLVVVAVVSELSHPNLLGDRVSLLRVCLIGWAVLLVSWVVVALLAPRITDNRPRTDMEELGMDPRI